jgi:hypothetical protein
MIASICTFVKMTSIAGLLFVSAAAGFDTSIAAATGRPPAESSGLSGSSAGKTPNGEPPKDEKPSGSLFPIEGIHEIIRQEREATLLEIDKDLEAVFKHLSQERLAILLEMENMRKATLTYLTGERKEVMEILIAELSRITDLLVAERQATMLELEVAGNRIVEGALQRSERLIDHFFIRLSQLMLAVALGLGIIAWIILHVLARRKIQAT